MVRLGLFCLRLSVLDVFVCNLFFGMFVFGFVCLVFVCLGRFCLVVLFWLCCLLFGGIVLSVFCDV